MGASTSLWRGPRRTNTYRFNRSSFDQIARVHKGAGQSTVDSLTDYEKSLLPDLWKKANRANPNFCFNVYGRFLSLCPELRPFFHLPSHKTSKCQYDATDCDILHPQADRLSTFLASLIDGLASDSDNMINECRKLGALHASLIGISSPSRKMGSSMKDEALNKSLVCAMSIALRPVSPLPHKARSQYGARIPSYAWSAFAEALVREFDATLDCNDVGERELELLAWSHLVEIVCAAVADAYETNSRTTREGRS